MLTVNIWNKQPVSLLFTIFRRKLIIMNYAFKYILDSSDRYIYMIEQSYELVVVDTCQ